MLFRFCSLLCLSLLLIGCASPPNSWRMHIIDNTSRGADGTKLIDANGDGHLEIVTGWEQGNLAQMYINPGDLSEHWPYVEVSAPNVEDALPIDLDGDGSIDLVTTYDGAENRSGVLWSTFDSLSSTWVHNDVSGLAGIKYEFATLIDMDGDGDLDILTSEEANNSQQGPGLGVIWYDNPHL